MGGWVGGWEELSTYLDVKEVALHRSALPRRPPILFLFRQVEEEAVAGTLEGQGRFPEEGFFARFTGEELPHVRFFYLIEGEG